MFKRLTHYLISTFLGNAHDDSNSEHESYDKTKLIYLAATFFFIIGSYSILRSLKTSIFLGLVGKEYQPIAKILAIVIMFPVMFGYSKLVDRLKRHQLVYCFLGLYAIIGLISAYCIYDPTIGLRNTITSPYRIFGWLFEIFMDLYQAMIVSTFWGFVNTISTPRFASAHYGSIVAGSRVGGMLTTTLSLILLEYSSLEGWHSIPLLILVASFFLAGAAFCIYKITTKVPHKYLHGYEAAYQAAKKDAQTAQHPGVLEGLKLMVTEPYVLGIFTLAYSFEIINIIFDYQMAVLMSIEKNNEILAMSSFMLMYTLTFQALSFVFALFGTAKLLKKIGIQKCLMIMPIGVIALTAGVLAYPQLWTIFVLMVIMRSLHYGFNQPIREILFIPTVKDIQFKSKAWIDSFGRTLSKTSGSALNMLTIGGSTPYVWLLMQSSFSFGISLVWIFVAFFVGKKYVQTITNNEVIGKHR